MAINNELSSEIAVALLASSSKTTEERNELKKLILTVHDTLQDMARQEKDRDEEGIIVGRRLGDSY